MDITDIRIGNGYDVHQLGEGLDLFLGGVKIPHTKGCIAHSDGDVAIHALCDAILGALALGDIGKHFPDTDPKYKDANSLSLLKQVCKKIKERGYKINNIDSNIIAQAPKMMPYIPKMKDSLAKLLDINPNEISIKAKTKEKLDSVGESLAIEANAVILLKRIDL